MPPIHETSPSGLWILNKLLKRKQKNNIATSKKKIQAEMATFVPFSTFLDSSFWSEVNKKKLNEWMLDETPRTIQAQLSICKENRKLKYRKENKKLKYKIKLSLAAKKTNRFELL